jgi:hypothetical protein
MKAIRLVLLALALIVCAAVPRAQQAADPKCLAAIQETAKRARQQANIYLGEMKGVTDNPWARNSVSVCSSAISRAEQYSKRQTITDTLCTTGSAYVDSQAIQLYKTANSTCRAEFENFLRRLPADEQRLISDRVARAEAGFR